MHELKSIDPISSAKVVGASLALIALIPAVIIMLIVLVAPVQNKFVGYFGKIAAIFVLFIFPFIYGAIGIVMGFLYAFFYNVVAGKTGGIRLELSEVKEAELKEEKK